MSYSYNADYDKVKIKWFVPSGSVPANLPTISALNAEGVDLVDAGILSASDKATIDSELGVINTLTITDLGAMAVGDTLTGDTSTATGTVYSIDTNTNEVVVYNVTVAVFTVGGEAINTGTYTSTLAADSEIDLALTFEDVISSVPDVLPVSAVVYGAVNEDQIISDNQMTHLEAVSTADTVALGILVRNDILGVK